MSTFLDDRQVVNRAPLSALGNTANETLDVIMGDINTFFANATFLPTASVLMTRDANANTQVNNLLEGFATTATAAGTTTLLVGSKAFQQFTGSTTQTVVLPAANTLTLGQSFTIVNRSTGNVTVQNGTPTTIQTMTANSQAVFTVTNIGSVAGTWDIAYTVTGPPTFLQTQVTTDATTTGSAATLLTADTSFGNVRLTNASLVSVSGIVAGASGQRMIIENQTGNTITINNNDAGASAANRIFTGTGGAASMAANASFEFTYDTTISMWMLVGGTGSGSGSGSKNYLTTYIASTSSGVPNTGNGNFELGSTTGWALGTIGTLTNGLPTGSPTFGSGASGNLSISTVSGGTQIGGSYSLSYASSAATTQGNMVASNAFFIDAEDQGKVLTVKFYYEVASGAANDNFSGTSSNSFAWAIYDVTNSAWLGTAGQFGMTQNSGTGYVTGTFQTAITTTQLRICIYNVNATSGAITLYFDDFSLGPQTAPFGPSVTDWQSYTLTIGGTTSAPTPGTTSLNAAKWRRVGDSMEIFYQLIQTATGSAGSGTYLFPIPSGYSIDTTKLNVSSGTGNTIGVGSVTGQAGGDQGPCVVIAHDTTNLTLNVYNATVNSASGEFVGSSFYSLSTFAGTIYTFTAKVPITGWSSNLQMSNDTDTRVVAMQVTQTSPTATVTGTFSLIKYTASPTQDTHGAFSTSTGLYTVPVTGFYKCSTGLGVAATYTNTTESAVAIAHNGTAINAGSQVAAAAEGSLYPFISTTIFCIAGDTLSPQVLSSGTSPTVVANTTTNFFTVERLSGPSIVAATESVNARYTSTAGQSITNGSTVTVVFGTKDFDSHNAMNSSTGFYTVPTTGKYAVKTYVQWAVASFSVGTVNSIDLYKNGSFFGRLGEVSPAATASQNIGMSGSDTVSCLAGDTLDLRASHNESTPRSLQTTAGLVHMAIERVGN